MDTAEPYEPAANRNRTWFVRLIPVFVLAAGAAVFFGFGLHSHLNFETLRTNRNELIGWVEENRVLAVLAFITVYAAAIVFVPPSGAVMTVFGGFLFGAIWGTAWVVVGATIGATLLFLSARLSVGDALRRRAGNSIRKLEAGFRENALSYMLVLRLVPLFPFWLVNLAPAFLGVSLPIFVFGTFVGIIPGTAVYAIFGAGLGSIFDRNEEISLAGIITPEILAALVGLAILSLIPVIYKRFKGKPAPRSEMEG